MHREILNFVAEVEGGFVEDFKAGIRLLPNRELGFQLSGVYHSAISDANGCFEPSNLLLPLSGKECKKMMFKFCLNVFLFWTGSGWVWWWWCGRLGGDGGTVPAMASVGAVCPPSQHWPQSRSRSRPGHSVTGTTVIITNKRHLQQCSSLHSYHLLSSIIGLSFLWCNLIRDCKHQQ